MKKLKKSIICLLSICVAVLFNINIFAHSGRTDANGGHRDNKNVSGLGSYHYHCGGYPAHLHKNGVCPYKTNSSKTETKILAESIEINEENIVIEVGETKILTATISPINVTDDTIDWSTNNEDVVIISASGKIEGVKEGVAVITAATSNNKNYTVKVTVNEPKTIETVNKHVETNKQVNSTKNDESSFSDTLLGFGIIGGVGYMGYKSYKKKKL